VIGKRFGNYTATALLGEGGMGVVYLAEHQGIGRRVAVKVLRADRDRDPDLLRRFVNEARAANAVRHPGIVEILDAGTTGDGQAYLVMELLEGETLAARLRRTGRLPLEDAVGLALRAASALGAAHARGIVHRDLKPDNLFLARDPVQPGKERLKVLDFGIAKLREPAPGSPHTRTGVYMGTPLYASPEQCRGNRAVDGRSDVYSLGVILYEMTCGGPPFVSDGFGELVDMHLNATPQPPRERRPDMGAALESVVLRMLAKDPELRYPAMDGVMVALRATQEEGLSDTSAAHSPLGVAATVSSEQAAVDVHGSTLTAAAGERAATQRRPASRALAAIVVAGVVTAAGAAAWLLWPRPVAAPPVSGRPVPPSRPPAPRPPAVVQLRIQSKPAGARVVRTGDGAQLGVTPFTLEQPRGAPAIEVRFEKDGHRAVTLDLSFDRTTATNVALEPKPAAPHARPRASRPYEPPKL
jgi:serine/threonine-protein kinase